VFVGWCVLFAEDPFYASRHPESYVIDPTQTDSPLRLRLYEHVFAPDHKTLGAELLNESERPITINYRNHPWDSLDIRYFDERGRLIAEMKHYGCHLFGPSGKQYTLELPPGKSYRFVVGGLFDWFRENGPRRSAVLVQAVFTHENRRSYSNPWWVCLDK
jgi:hypothetical protein